VTDIEIGSIAAGIQAGMGNVAAGSIFATLTSAAMAGYGVPVVYGGVWGTSSAVYWGLAARRAGVKVVPTQAMPGMAATTQNKSPQ
jgi:hypothetical protein